MILAEIEPTSSVESDAPSPRPRGRPRGKDYESRDPEDEKREHEPHLVIIFGPFPWTPNSTCKEVHPRGGIRRGSRLCCGRCHKSGLDYLLVGRRHATKDRTNRKYSPDPVLKGGCGVRCDKAE